jgi:hypothetical protein
MTLPPLNILLPHLVKKTQNKDLCHAMSYYLIGFVVRILSKITVFGINQIGFKSWSVNAHENHFS